MKMSPSIVLNEVQIEEIRKLVGEQRQVLGFIGETPIGHDIFTILEKKNIILLEYPVKSVDGTPSFSAALMYSEEEAQELIFIGLNTADYFDKQIFAVAHELYHFFTKTGSHLSRLDEEEHNLIEAMANRFAAEFLLPEIVLKSLVLNEFKTNSLFDIQFNPLLRFIARLHCTWWLPYRSLVKRLKEIDAISEQQYEALYGINERDMNGFYGRIGQATNLEAFSKLNTISYNIGTSAKDVEVIIRNYEDNIIDEDEFLDAISLFNKRPEDFGYELNISEEDIDEMKAFFNKEVDDEG